MASRKKATAARARRYTLPEREKILKYVEDVNAQKGRGGQTAAVQKFGVSALTITSWMRKRPEGAGGEFTGSTNGTGGTLAKLAAVHAAIVAKEKEIASLQAQFNKLKASI
jgi:hypothetical protein